MPPSSTPITIYHNVNCTTSRNTLALIRNTGVEPQVIMYLETPPTREALAGLLAALKMKPRDLLRRKGTPYDELKLAEPHWTDDELIDQMLAHPILMERPIVITPLGIRVCRPSEMVLDLLPDPHRGAFAKEDGEQVINDKGLRVSAH
ncbi:glutaredoxin-dependent arsenate reductase [soil metagenome]